MYVVGELFYPMKLKTTKKSTKLQNAKSPNAFSGVMFLNSDDDVSCNRSEAVFE